MKTEKKSIGLDREKFDNVIRSYRVFIEALNSLWEHSRKTFPDFELKELIAFTATKQDPAYWLMKRHVEKHPDQFRGFDVDKIIEAGLISLPNLDKTVNAQLRVRDSIYSNFQASIKTTNLFFPIAKLFDQENDIFTHTPEFNGIVMEFCTIYLETPEQEQVYEALQQLIPSINLFKKLGLMEKIKFSHNFDQIAYAFSPEADQYKVKPTCFRTPFLHTLNQEVENPGKLRDIYQI